MNEPAPGRYCYDYPRPGLTADVIVLSREPRQRVLLIQRKNEPFQGAWALPGGYVNEMEPTEQAARRELLEETGLHAGELFEVGIFSEPGRDPRGWTVSAAYLTFVDPQTSLPVASDDAAAVAWHCLDELPALAFDHAFMLAKARQRR